MREYKRPLYTKKHFDDMAFSLNHDVYTSFEKKAIMGFLINRFRFDGHDFDENRFIKACGGVPED